MFRFDLGATVLISCSGEVGTVIGRGEYLSKADNQYSVRYKSADGRAVECWWDEAALELAAD